MSEAIYLLPPTCLHGVDRDNFTFQCSLSNNKNYDCIPNTITTANATSPNIVVATQNLVDRLQTMNFTYFWTNASQNVSWDSSVCIATTLWTGRPRNCSLIPGRSNRVFSTPKLSRSSGLKLTTHFHLRLWLRMRESYLHILLCLHNEQCPQ